MSTVTVSEGLRRAARLIPFRAAGASRLTGEYGAVLTPAATVPAMFREAQEERTAHYLTTRGPSARSKPDHAPRYWVTSYGVPIAWVTLDGRTHFSPDHDLVSYSNGDDVSRQEWQTMVRHRDAIRAAWPERFAMNGQGDPIYLHDGDGRNSRFAPAGTRQTCDARGYVHIIAPDGACNICPGEHTDAPAYTLAELRDGTGFPRSARFRHDGTPGTFSLSELRDGTGFPAGAVFHLV